ncbi:TolC family protein [Polynucleobacter sp. MWH-Braz-FAM2G]|uniref:TolC family protein n=1 Tax=Polynucleobacter sp. MWH-Braz-FAM2G TaxID=1855883 RepID=UPI001BFE54EF|nr:TolC family protein [Polynucleobacter sp. MWH-Braz-FAM2G]QWD90252.1 TolC family protein [Polynucleobacter sp. MWH-Braz-FAM2G]
MKLHRLLAVIAIGSVLTTNVFAQTQKSYTINDLITIALESSPQVLAARDQSKAIKGQLSAARAIPNPEFEIGTGQQRSVTGPLTVGNVSSWAVTQPLDMPYTRFPRVNAAEANFRSAEATRIAFEVETISKVQQRFYELMRREAEAKAFEEDLNLTKQIRDRMQVRYDVGETARFDLIRSQTEFLNAQIAAESGKLRVEQARSQLRQTVGHTLPPHFSVVPEQPKTETLPPLNILLTELQSQSPELQKAKADVEASESKLSFEKNARLPRLAFKASQYNDPNFTDRLYGLQISIPIWDFRGGQIAEAEANASKAKNQLNAQSQSLEQQLETAYKLYQIATYQVKVLDQEVVQLAATAQRIAEVSYRYGERGMLEYLDAQRTFRAARNDLIKARFDLASVVTEIQRLRASPEWLAKIESGMQ